MPADSTPALLSPIFAYTGSTPTATGTIVTPGQTNAPGTTPVVPTTVPTTSAAPVSSSGTVRSTSVVAPSSSHPTTIPTTSKPVATSTGFPTLSIPSITIPSISISSIPLFTGLSSLTIPHVLSVNTAAPAATSVAAPANKPTAIAAPANGAPSSSPASSGSKTCSSKKKRRNLEEQRRSLDEQRRGLEEHRRRFQHVRHLDYVYNTNWNDLHVLYSVWLRTLHLQISAGIRVKHVLFTFLFPSFLLVYSDGWPILVAHPWSRFLCRYDPFYVYPLSCLVFITSLPLLSLLYSLARHIDSSYGDPAVHQIIQIQSLSRWPAW